MSQALQKGGPTTTTIHLTHRASRLEVGQRGAKTVHTSPLEGGRC